MSWEDAVKRSHIPAKLRSLVIERAKGCCEYCLLSQDYAIATHHLDHLLALKHGGRTKIENLAFVCARCNRRKGSDIASIDPADGTLVMLFNPREQVWREHFTLDGAVLVGLTPSGRATVELLQMNHPARIAMRRKLMDSGLYPPAHIR